MKKIKENKTLNIILKTIKYIFVVMFILFVLMVCLQRFSNNRISVFNFRLFTVISGSMEPKYKIGDVLVAVETDPSEIKVGDAISYLGAKGSFKDKVITHEVVDIEQTKAGKYRFHAKGLANAIEDPVVDESQLYGVVKYKVKTLSLIYRVVGTPVGIFVFVILPLMYIIGSEMVISLLEKEKERRNKQQ